jgi:hypothetical protein
VRRWGVALIAAAAFTGCAAQAASAPPHIYSIRTERGAAGHTITTVAFPVRVQGEIYLCVVSEDQAPAQGGGGTALTLAQSCDFDVSR